MVENDDNNNINNEDIEEKESEEEPNTINNNDRRINTINNLKKKSKLYKINNDSILKMKDIEYELIIECLKFFSCYVLDSIRDYLKNENQIISEIKNNLDKS